MQSFLSQWLSPSQQELAWQLLQQLLDDWHGLCDWLGSLSAAQLVSAGDTQNADVRMLHLSMHGAQPASLSVTSSNCGVCITDADQHKGIG